MKNLITLLIVISSSFYAQINAQAGVYLTVNDLKKENLLDLGEFVEYKSGKLYFQKDSLSEKEVYKVIDIYAFKDNEGFLCRFSRYTMYKLRVKGACCIWSNDHNLSVEFKSNNGRVEIEFDEEEVSYNSYFYLMYSKSITSELLPNTHPRRNKELLKILRADSKLYKIVKDIRKSKMSYYDVLALYILFVERNTKKDKIIAM